MKTSDFTNGFKLCLCNDESIKYRQQEFYRNLNNELVKIPNKRNKNIPVIYTWRLYRVINIAQNYESCSFVRPVNEIGSGLNDESILINLNFEKIFDFEYQPLENDNLIIETNEFGSLYISFIFEKNEWKIGYHIPFEYDVEEIYRGKIIEIE